MKLVADESVDRQIVERLRRTGHNVLAIAETDPGISDDVVLDLANGESALLVTADKDFGELVFRQGRISTGVLLIRLAGLAPDTKADLVVSAVAEHQGELRGNFSVVSPRAIRIRRNIS